MPVGARGRCQLRQFVEGDPLPTSSPCVSLAPCPRGPALTRLVPSAAVTLYAWALLPNHFHLPVRTGKRPLARAMRPLHTGYAAAFNPPGVAPRHGDPPPGPGPRAPRPPRTGPDGRHPDDLPPALPGSGRGASNLPRSPGFVPPRAPWTSAPLPCGHKSLPPGGQSRYNPHSPRASSSVQSV